MRVLITLDAVGGVWHYALDLAAGLAQRGVEPVLALLGPAPDMGQRAQAQALAGVSWVETGCPLDWLCDGPSAVLAAGAAISRLAGALDADLVHLNAPALAAGMDRMIPQVAVAHGCVGTWWAAAHPGAALAGALAWHGELMRQGLLAADLVVAPSAAFARTLARHYDLPVMPRNVHNGRPRPAQTPPQVWQDRALTVGRLWDRVKRAALLDAVAGELAVPFDAAGQVTGPHGEYAALAHLNLLGQLDAAALDRRLALRPVFVAAASFEPFGLAVLEAANAGCALVLSDIDTFQELWGGASGDEAALFVAGDDPQAYRQAIMALIGDPARRAGLGRAARQRAARYTTAAMADAMLAIYGDVLADHAAAGRAAA